MSLVILAAGHGRRFGGLKQLAAVGPEDQVLLDYTALDAEAAGFDSVVLVVRESIREEIVDHVKRHWPSSLAWDTVVQGPVAGTAQAVLSAAPLVDGPFGVANADDLYGLEALTILRSHLVLAGEDGSRADEVDEVVADDAPRQHVIVGFRLADTVSGSGTVTRGICRTDPDGALVDIIEQKVTPVGGESGGFAGRPAASEPGSPTTPLSGDELVSMNLWAFQPRIFGHLQAAVDAFDPPPPPPEAAKPPELLLPDVVQQVVLGHEDSVSVFPAGGRCIGITNPDDLAFVRKLIQGRRPGDPLDIRPDGA